MNIRKGDIVARKSYGKDIYFFVDRLIKINMNTSLAILKGLNIRIIADSLIDDLEKVSKKEAINYIKSTKMNIENKTNINEKQTRKKIYTGKILHLDGDRKYSEKSAKYYNKMGLNAMVKNIAENKQARVVVPLLRKYNPDILIITGHDAMLRHGTNYNNIYNYRNSRQLYKHCKNSKNMG